jgi:hypothetical protein
MASDACLYSDAAVVRAIALEKRAAARLMAATLMSWGAFNVLLVFRHDCPCTIDRRAAGACMSSLSHGRSTQGSSPGREAPPFTRRHANTNVTAAW